MTEATLAQELAFVIAQSQQDEAVVLAQAVRAGIRALYREALIGAYLTGRIAREQVLAQLGPGALAEIEYQRDVLECDIAWGMRDV